MYPSVKINPMRVWQNLEDLSLITDKSQPWTRRCFTPIYLQGRDWLVRQISLIGLDHHVDAAGNLIATRPGKNPKLKPLLMGSHSDTVPSGGRYDGILGVLAALEVLHSLQEQKISTEHPLEIIDFLSEEPSDFGLSCIGSRAMAGLLRPQDLLTTRFDGMTLAEGLCCVGGDPDRLDTAIRAPQSIAGYLELHIEQGRVLEDQQLQIGIVTGIYGIERYQITFVGQTDHAGATPMERRQDALVAAADFISYTHKYARATNSQQTPLVATIGRLALSPNAANAIPGEVILTLDTRALEQKMLRQFIDHLKQRLTHIQKVHNITTYWHTISRGEPVSCHFDFQKTIQNVADQAGFSHCKLPSGAGHDGVYISRLGPVGMIFTPCKKGISHSPKESITPEQAANGTQVLANTLLKLDKLLA